MKKTLFIASIALLASACASTQTAQAPASADEATQAIAAAKASAKKAAAVGYQWRDTGKLIAGAEKALKANDAAKAIKLATKAQRQGEYAVQQQAAQSEAVKQY